MRWNHFAGTSIVPTLARLVLALAFIPAGYAKIFNDADFTADQAEVLRGLGVELEPGAEPVAYITFPQQGDEADAGNDVDDTAPGGDQPPAEEQDSSSDTDGGESESPEQNTDDQPGDDEQGEIIEIPDSEPTQVFRGGMVNHLVLLLHENDIARPRLMAWIAALTEFVGGILILFGLFSRVWGLGLAITMAMAFYLTTMQQYFIDVGPFEAAASMEHGWLVSTVMTQLGLCVLALTVFLVGPGPLSLDRLIFRPRRAADRFDDAEPRHSHRETT